MNLLGVQTAVFGSEVNSLDARRLADHWVPAQLTTVIQLGACVSLAALALALHRLLGGTVATREKALPRAACGVAVVAAVVSLLGFVQYEALYLAGVLTVVWVAWTAAACLRNAQPTGVTAPGSRSRGPWRRAPH